MLPIGKLSYSYASLLVIIFWIITNSSSEQSLHVNALALVIFISLISLHSILALTFRLAYISRNSAFFITLIFLMSLRLLYDLDISKSKELIIGTTGGIFLFYILGCFVKFNVDVLCKYWRTTPIHFSLFLCFLSAFTIIWYITIITNTTTDDIMKSFVFSDGSYQRKGALLTILYITFIYMYLADRQNLVRSQKFYIATVLPVTSILMFYSQYVRSNSGFVTVLFIFVFTAFINYSILGRKDRLQALTITLLSIIFGLVYVSMYVPEYMQFISKLRIFGYGSFDYSSITSRLDLLNESLDQFQFGPILGDVNSDFKAGQPGKYPHNFLGHALTHFGLVGFTYMVLVFLALLVKCRSHVFLRNFLSSRYTTDVTADISAIIIPIILISFMFQTITWAPFWFTLGLIYPFIVLKK